ncbi:Cyb5p [Lachancea thermotolerans CBS 6340]|uniref:KLTH0D09284p n=1 Tax=Lachancea thermotolerans (strain ATCC 56472 / CBS 6340 / NRRL Y-8284) TaxID=559295 RepID=C5DGY5_LACTC|nr:KLTH0D09284p [Lachancea thermotolerans CBS 6340]CAR22677.1 KLTH0D09284p [Lachancea thermotolerans CBS 6340]
MAKLYSYKEIAEHNTENDLWMIIDGKVYDCTKFMDEHPGGEEVLLDLGGQDATGPFADIGHSDDAVKMLEDLYVGDVDKDSEPIAVVKGDPASTTTGGEGNGVMILAIAAVALAVVYFYLNQK